MKPLEVTPAASELEDNPVPVQQPREQTDINSCNATIIRNYFENDPFYGDLPSLKREKVIRLVSINVGNMPLDFDGNKNKQLFTATSLEPSCPAGDPQGSLILR